MANNLGGCITLESAALEKPFQIAYKVDRAIGYVHSINRQAAKQFKWLFAWGLWWQVRRDTQWENKYTCIIVALDKNIPANRFRLDMENLCYTCANNRTNLTNNPCFMPYVDLSFFATANRTFAIWSCNKSIRRSLEKCQHPLLKWTVLIISFKFPAWSGKLLLRSTAHFNHQNRNIHYL